MDAPGGRHRDWKVIIVHAKRHPDKIEVLVCDPNPLDREGLMAILRREPDVTVVGCVGDLKEAVESALALVPTIMVLPHRPPAFDGIAVASTLAQRDATHDIKVLLLLNEPAEDQLLMALQAGVGGLLPRDTPLQGLVSAVRGISAGDVVLAFPSAAHLLKRISSQLPLAFVTGGPALASLTSRELEVLLRVAKGQSNQVIAEELSLSAATVKSHLYHLYQKLGLRDRTQAVIFAYETGLVTACAG